MMFFLALGGKSHRSEHDKCRIELSQTSESIVQAIDYGAILTSATSGADGVL